MWIIKKFLSMSRCHQILFLTFTVFAPYLAAVQFSLSALRADALDDRRYERMIRTFADRLESDAICEKIASLNPNSKDPCQEMPTQQDDSRITGI